MQVTILAGFLVALTALETGELARHVPPWLGAGTYVLASAVLSWLGAAVPLRALRGPQPISPAAGRGHALLGLAGQLWMAGGLGLAIWAGYGRWIEQQAHLDSVPVLGPLAAIAPLLAAAALHWLLDYPLQRDLRARRGGLQAPWGLAPRPPWRRKDYFLFNLRQDVLMVGVPLVLILGVHDCVRLYLVPHLPGSWQEGVRLAGSVAGAAGVLLVAPWLIVRAWGTRPLPPGPLREALTDVLRRAGVSFRQTLLWPTGLNVANAAVLGVIRPFRYALLSDALVEFLDARDVEAVFHHEVRHVSAHHLFYLMLYVLSAATLCAWAGDGLVWLAERAMEPQTPLGDGWRAGAALALLVGAMGTSFGWISRRFERQCDAFAAWRMGGAQAPPGGTQPPVAAVADPVAVEGAAGPSGAAARRVTPEGAAAFCWALQRIVQINCGSLYRGNWRHGSVAWRLQYLMSLSTSGGTIDQVDRVVRRIKLGIGAAALAAAALWTVEVVAACTQQR